MESPYINVCEDICWGYILEHIAPHTHDTPTIDTDTLFRAFKRVEPLLTVDFRVTYQPHTAVQLYEFHIVLLCSVSKGQFLASAHTYADDIAQVLAECTPHLRWRRCDGMELTMLLQPWDTNTAYAIHLAPTSQHATTDADDTHHTPINWAPRALQSPAFWQTITSATQPLVFNIRMYTGYYRSIMHTHPQKEILQPGDEQRDAPSAFMVSRFQSRRIPHIQLDQQMGILSPEQIENEAVNDPAQYEAYLRADMASKWNARDNDNGKIVQQISLASSERINNQFFAEVCDALTDGQHTSLTAIYTSTQLSSVCSPTQYTRDGFIITPVQCVAYTIAGWPHYYYQEHRKADTTKDAISHYVYMPRWFSDTYFYANLHTIHTQDYSLRINLPTRTRYPNRLSIDEAQSAAQHIYLPQYLDDDFFDYLDDYDPYRRIAEQSIHQIPGFQIPADMIVWTPIHEPAYVIETQTPSSQCIQFWHIPTMLATRLHWHQRHPHPTPEPEPSRQFTSDDQRTVEPSVVRSERTGYTNRVSSPDTQHHAHPTTAGSTPSGTTPAHRASRALIQLPDAQQYDDYEGYRVIPALMPTPVIPSTLADFPIEALELTTRSKNCLRRANVTTVGQLLSMTSQQIASIRNMSEAHAATVIETVIQHITSLGHVELLLCYSQEHARDWLNAIKDQPIIAPSPTGTSDSLTWVRTRNTYPYTTYRIDNNDYTATFMGGVVIYARALSMQYTHDAFMHALVSASYPGVLKNLFLDIQDTLMDQDNTPDGVTTSSTPQIDDELMQTSTTNKPTTHITDAPDWGAQHILPILTHYEMCQSNAHPDQHLYTYPVTKVEKFILALRLAIAQQRQILDIVVTRVFTVIIDVRGKIHIWGMIDERSMTGALNDIPEDELFVRFIHDTQYILAVSARGHVYHVTAATISRIYVHDYQDYAVCAGHVYALQADGMVYPMKISRDHNEHLFATPHRIRSFVHQTRAIAGSQTHLVYLTKTGDIYTEIENSVSRIATSSQAQFVSIAAGDHCTYALDSTGKVHHWGAQYHTDNLPSQGVTQIRACQQQLCVQFADGTAACFGASVPIPATQHPYITLIPMIDGMVVGIYKQPKEFLHRIPLSHLVHDAAFIDALRSHNIFDNAGDNRLSIDTWHSLQTAFPAASEELILNLRRIHGWLNLTSSTL